MTQTLYPETMIDIECFDTKHSAVVVTVAAVNFDPTRIADQDELDANSKVWRLPVGPQEALGRTISADTVLWWLSQEKAAQEALLKAEPVNMNQFVSEFRVFTKNSNKVWAKGPDFDCIIMSHLFEQLQAKWPWPFYKARDVRTITDGIPKEDLVFLEGAAHDALWDAQNQVLSVQYAKALA